MKIPDDKESKQRAIESDLFETSAPSEESDISLHSFKTILVGPAVVLLNFGM